MAGCGGTVTQPLPLLDRVEPPAVAPGDSTKVLPSLRGLSVLVVDDALDARDSLAMFLEECGARVTAVASAAEALEALPLARPDVLVSDLAMPGIDGYGLLARMRELEAGGARWWSGSPNATRFQRARLNQRCRSCSQVKPTPPCISTARRAARA